MGLFGTGTGSSCKDVGSHRASGIDMVSVRSIQVLSGMIGVDQEKLR